MSSGESADARRITRARLVAPIASVAAVVVGVALVMYGEIATYGYGWFSYAPVPDTTFWIDPSGLFAAGCALIGLGLVGAAFVAGRRRRALALSVGSGVLVAAGVVVLVSAAVPHVGGLGGFVSPGPESFAFVGGAVLPAAAETALLVGGIGLATVGLATLAYRLGRRRRTA